jgi:hypothetical protein
MRQRCEANHTLRDTICAETEPMNWMHATAIAASLLGAAGLASAQACPTGSLRVSSGKPATPNDGSGTLQSFIANATVCVARGSERWQEFHAGNGDLIDYKRGPSDRMDPTKKVGTWSVSGLAAQATGTDPRGARAPRDEGPVLVHTYGNTSYSFAVCVPAAEARRTNPGYILSSPTAGTFNDVRILPGQVPCP